MASTITSFPTFVAGTKAKSSEINTCFNNYRGTIVPINTDTATASDFAHDLGTEDHRFKRAYIATGYWEAGDIKAHHTYNGTTPIGRGWMKCDGRIVNEANYDAEFSSGAWAREIVSSPLNGKYLPNLTNKYLTGSTATAQDGTSALTFIGNTGSVANIEHTHQWYDHPASPPSVAVTYDSDGVSTFNIVGNSSDSTSGLEIGAGIGGGGEFALSKDAYVKNGGATAQSIRPESLETIFYMRII